MVFRLEQRGLIEQTRDIKDRRIVLMSVTPKGKRVLKESNEVSWELINRVMDVLSEDEQNALTDILAKLETLGRSLLNGAGDHTETVSFNDHQPPHQKSEYSLSDRQSDDPCGVVE